MFKNICKMEIQIGEKLFTFLCDQDSPIEHVKEFVFQLSKQVAAIEDAIKAAQAQQAVDAEAKAKADEEASKVESIKLDTP